MKLPKYDWQDLEQRARVIVDRCVAALPDEIRNLAERVPCLLRRYHPNAPHIDPEAMYMLGEYVAHDGAEGTLDESGVILIYLGAIAWYCEDEGLDFEEEIETTFLHELGHHFGWDEDAVEERGL